jgi:hypothetical protein
MELHSLDEKSIKEDVEDKMFIKERKRRLFS